MVEADELLVAAPHDGVDDELPEPGAKLELHWGTVRGACMLPVVFEGLRPGRVPMWRLKTNGDLKTVQRRRYARASATGKITLHSPRGLTGVGWGSVLDVGERGVRCLVSAGIACAGDPVDVILDLDEDGTLELQGSILRVHNDVGGYDQVVVTFEAGEREAERIRQYVLMRHRHERRVGRA